MAAWEWNVGFHFDHSISAIGEMDKYINMVARVEPMFDYCFTCHPTNPQNFRMASDILLQPGMHFSLAAGAILPHPFP
ncbi:MAG: hypothetical protein H0W34_01595 [Pyrinomonadaceae bacterium]|nr:hypothetical protein [Pyrinomonadaceae bacterium]